TKGTELKEVQFLTLGEEEPVRAEMLRKGLVDAICVAPPGPNRLAREGFNVLGGPKDLKIGSPISAVAATDSRIKNSRDETKKVLRAVVRGLRFILERKEEVIPIMVKWLDQTPDVARDSYDLILPSFSLDGSTIDKTYEFAIDARKGLSKRTKSFHSPRCETFLCSEKCKRNCDCSKLVSLSSPPRFLALAASSFDRPQE